MDVEMNPMFDGLRLGDGVDPDPVLPGRPGQGPAVAVGLEAQAERSRPEAAEHLSAVGVDTEVFPRCERHLINPSHLLSYAHPTLILLDPTLVPAHPTLARVLPTPGELPAVHSMLVVSG